MTGRRTFALGLLYCALAVAGGALGAHALASRLDARGLELWETAARYLMYGGLSLACMGAFEARAEGRTSLGLAAGIVAVGTAVFSLTVALLALGSARWLGAITPLGGVLMIGGLAFASWRVLASSGGERAG